MAVVFLKIKRLHPVVFALSNVLIQRNHFKSLFFKSSGTSAASRGPRSNMNLLARLGMALMNRVNHSQLLNHGGRRRQEGLFHPFSREFCSRGEMCVSAGAGQLGGHQLPIQILLLQRISLFPRDPRGNLDSPGSACLWRRS